MRCYWCKKLITPATLIKAIVEYRQADGSIKTYGFNEDSGPVSAATGQLCRAYHYKCYQIAHKREGRGGDALTGRGMSSVPTAYQLDQMVMSKDDVVGLSSEELAGRSTNYLSDQMIRLREIAQEVGANPEDWEVAEIFRAEQHGGPYDHQHLTEPENFSLAAHLTHAHGVPQPASEHFVDQRATHSRLHVAMEARRTREVRAADPGYREPHEADWRDQFTTEVGEVEFTGEESL